MTNGPFRKRSWLLDLARRLLWACRLTRLRMLGRFQFCCGSNVAIAAGADVRPPHHLRLGDYVSIGKNFTCEVDLTVGSEVLISSNVAVVGKDHPFEDLAVSVYFAPRSDRSPVEIGNDVLIGFGTIVVGPVKVGAGCIVGAGSVITQDLPAGMVCAGVPARPIRARWLNAAEQYQAAQTDIRARS